MNDAKEDREEAVSFGFDWIDVVVVGFFFQKRLSPLCGPPPDERRSGRPAAGGDADAGAAATGACQADADAAEAEAEACGCGGCGGPQARPAGPPASDLGVTWFLDGGAGWCVRYLFIFFLCGKELKRRIFV